MRIWPGVRIGAGAEVRSDVEITEHTHTNYEAKIAQRVTIGSSVRIVSGNWPMNAGSAPPQGPVQGHSSDGLEGTGRRTSADEADLMRTQRANAPPPLRSLRSLHGNRGAVCHFRCPLTTQQVKGTVSTCSEMFKMQKGSLPAQQAGQAIPALTGYPVHHRLLHGGQVSDQCALLRGHAQAATALPRQSDTMMAADHLGRVRDLVGTPDVCRYFPHGKVLPTRS